MPKKKIKITIYNSAPTPKGVGSPLDPILADPEDKDIFHYLDKLDLLRMSQRELIWAAKAYYRQAWQELEQYWKNIIQEAFIEIGEFRGVDVEARTVFLFPGKDYYRFEKEEALKKALYNCFDESSKLRNWRPHFIKYEWPMFIKNAQEAEAARKEFSAGIEELKELIYTSDAKPVFKKGIIE
jgi:hypothetical protein